jgi:hypothetical protein
MDDLHRRPALRRERVTAPESPTTLPGAGDIPVDVDTVYVRSLVRSQLRLAVACAIGFAVLLAGFAASFVVVPDLGLLVVVGVPVSWLMLGFGVYPLVIAIAVIYVRASGRNEARYRSLSDRDRRELDPGTP